MPRGARAVSSRQEISQEANPLPYNKAIQIGTNICQTNTKPWNKESQISNSIWGCDSNPIIDSRVRGSAVRRHPLDQWLQGFDQVCDRVITKQVSVARHPLI